MIIAVPYEGGNIFQHFGHTAQFKLYVVKDGKVTTSRVVDTNGSGHGALAGFLEAQGVNVLICGGIGGGARFALQDADIEIFGGVSGDADEAVEAFAAGVLSFDPDACCNHHGEGHSCGHDHHCGDHHHEGHSCGHCHHE